MLFHLKSHHNRYGSFSHEEHGLNFSVDTEDYNIYKRIQKATLDSNIYAQKFRNYVSDHVTRAVEKTGTESW